MRFSERIHDDTRWALIGGAAGALFVLAAILIMTTPANERLASNAPPAIDHMVTPPITQPSP